MLQKGPGVPSNIRRLVSAKHTFYGTGNRTSMITDLSYTLNCVTFLIQRVITGPLLSGSARQEGMRVRGSAKSQGQGPRPGVYKATRGVGRQCLLGYVLIITQVRK